MIVRNGEATGSVLAEAFTEKGKLKAAFSKTEDAEGGSSAAVTEKQQDVTTEDAASKQAREAKQAGESRTATKPASAGK